MCRLLQPSPIVRKLGKYLHHEMIEHGDLSFVVWEQSGAPMLQRMDRQLLSQKVVETMIREQKFEMDRFMFQIRDKVLPTYINLCFGDMTMVPISGFPRSLLLTADNHNNSSRISQSAPPMFQTSLGAVTRAASRYTHGSRRLKRGAAWEPPSLQDSRGIPNLRQYGDPDRVIGLEVVDQQAAKGTDHESSLPEVVPAESKSAPVKQPIAMQYQTHEGQPGIVVQRDQFGFEVQYDGKGGMLVNPEPAPMRRLITMQQQRRPQEQPSARMTLRKAFRALLWPIRAHPFDSDNDFTEEREEDAMSQFLPFETGKPSPYSHDRRPSDYALGPGSYIPSPGPLTMQYYEVDSVENAIYQKWVNLLGPSMGGAWVPLNQSGLAPLRRAQMPGPPVMFGRHELRDTQITEMPTDFGMSAELSDVNYVDRPS